MDNCLASSPVNSSARLFGGAVAVLSRRGYLENEALSNQARSGWTELMPGDEAR